jgi:hypothetical protein
MYIYVLHTNFCMMSCFWECLVAAVIFLCCRHAKKEIRHLENELGRWQVLVDSVTGISPPDFDNQTLAVLRGRLVRYLMRSREVCKSHLTQKFCDSGILIEWSTFWTYAAFCFYLKQHFGEYSLSSLSGKRYTNLAPKWRMLIRYHWKQGLALSIGPSWVDDDNTNSVASVRKRTIPTERPLLVSKVSANFCR